MSGHGVSNYFSDSDLQRIKKIIQETESKTSGEIRVKVIGKCDDDLARDIYRQAIREFEREGLHNTRDKTGVLLLVVIEDRRFQILGDLGIYSKIPQWYWNEMARGLSVLFKMGDYTNGICHLVQDVGKELMVFFPRQMNDVNELTDDVILGGKE